jgi:hypothetical protein
MNEVGLHLLKLNIRSQNLQDFNKT